MNKKITAVGIIALFFACSPILKAQSYISKKIKNDKGNISLVTFKKASSLKGSNVGNVFNDVFKINADENLKLISTTQSQDIQDQRYAQYYENIPVEFGGYTVHLKNGQLSSISGDYFSTESIISTTPAISAENALNKAIQKVNAEKYMWEDKAYTSNNTYQKPKGDLVFVPVATSENSYTLFLAYKFDIYAALPLSRSVIYVDAMEGRILMEDALLKHTEAQHKTQNNHNTIINIPSKKEISKNGILVAGSADTRYSGTKNIETSSVNNSYILHDTTRGNGVHTYNLRKANTLSSAIEFQDNDNNWTTAEFDNENKDNAALDAHWGVEKTYDYFKDTFNRNSYDNNGAELKSYVHFQYNYENAGWTGSEMIYGDGVSLFRPLVSLDITAHELGHAVCQHTAQLVYERESGALNEGFSDIWGAIVEHKYAPEKNNFLIGEEITIPAPGYLRSMNDPKSGYSPQPDTYRGINWKAATVEEGCAQPDQLSNDYCGVHTNSGVLNHWFYILVEGKSGTNDLGHNYNVTGIGWEKAEKIVYRLETQYVTGSSDYAATRDFAIQAATDLYGEASPEAIAVQDAFYAVGVGYKYLSSPDTTPPTIPMNLSAENITGTSLKLNWDPSTDNEMMYGYIVYQDGEEIGTTPDTHLKVTGLNKNTTYHFTVKAEDIFNNISDESNVLEVTTTDFAEYCDSHSNSGNAERIKRVQFATLDQTSSAQTGYENFTNITTEIQKGETYTISITPEWRSSTYSEGYAVYIDWNADGDFNDSGETAFTQSPTKNNPVTGQITVPQTAALDQPLMMRVSMKFNSIPTACEIYPYGQVEDYKLVVKENLAIQDADKKIFAIYPNPVSDVINIKTTFTGEYTYTIFDMTGKRVKAGKNSAKRIDVPGLVSGNYLLEIMNQSGIKETIQFIKK